MQRGGREAAPFSFPLLLAEKAQRLENRGLPRRLKEAATNGA